MRDKARNRLQQREDLAASNRIWTGLGSGKAPANLVGEDELYGRLVPRWAEAHERTSRYTFRNKGGGVGQIDLYGPIGQDFFGDGITSASFAKQLKAMGDVRSIDLHIDSPGGSVTDATTIYTLLSTHRATVNVQIDGLAASAASYIAMAGDSIAISEAGFLMIHEARGRASGTGSDLRRAADTLDMVTSTIADIYVARTSTARKQIDSWMKAETWFTGREAVDAGFADTLIENKTANGKKATNCALLYAEAFGSLPSELLGRGETGRARAQRVLRDARAIFKEKN
jgi:ATP-dependent protease ClpP protease subunit